MKLRLITLLLLVVGTFAPGQGRSAPLTSEQAYGLHLFFNEQEFIDVLTLKYGDDGEISGHMFVPNDFSGDIENVQLQGESLSFDLFVPKNSSRPVDLIFHYQATFFDQGKHQLIGYVTIKGEKDFVASFVAFKR